MRVLVAILDPEPILHIPLTGSLEQSPLTLGHLPEDLCEERFILPQFHQLDRPVEEHLTQGREKVLILEVLSQHHGL